MLFIYIKTFMIKKLIKIFILFSLISSFSFPSFSDGWYYDGANWLYEENGEYVRADVRTIDGVNYYFDTYGYWIPRENSTGVKLKTYETKSFVMKGKDYEGRNYETKFTYLCPIIEGKNSEAINQFIRDNIEETYKKYIEEHCLNMLFLAPKLTQHTIIESYNEKNTIGFSFLGGLRLSLYINYDKMIMWVVR